MSEYLVASILFAAVAVFVFVRYSKARDFLKSIMKVGKSATGSIGSIKAEKIITFKNLIIFLVLLFLFDVFVLEKSMTRHFIGKVFSSGYIQESKKGKETASVLISPALSKVEKLNEKEWKIILNPRDSGWPVSMKIKTGKYHFYSHGEYERAFCDDGKNIYWERVFPDGQRRVDRKIQYYKGKLLSEDFDFGWLIYRINRSEVSKIGMGGEVDFSEDSEIEFGINTESNGQWNRGGPLEIRIKNIG
jgi:hypothetical protein